MTKIKELSNGIYLLLENHSNSLGDKFYKGETLVQVNNEQLVRVSHSFGDPAVLLADLQAGLSAGIREQKDKFYELFYTNKNGDKITLQLADDDQRLAVISLLIAQELDYWT